MTTDPFAALGLPAAPDLDDEQVRAAWRAIATATHPDRPDGGNPARYAAASAAYATLRTRWGRSEAYADLAAAAPPRQFRVIPPAAARRAPAAPARLSPWRAALLIPGRIRHGRPARLTLRIVAAAALAFLVLHSSAGTPPIAGLLTGIGTWLLLTVRGDLARRRAGDPWCGGQQATGESLAGGSLSRPAGNCLIVPAPVKGAGTLASLRDGASAPLDCHGSSRDPAPIREREQRDHATTTRAERHAASTGIQQQHNSPVPFIAGISPAHRT